MTLGGEPLSLSLRGGRRSTRHKGSGGPAEGSTGAHCGVRKAASHGCSLLRGLAVLWSSGESRTEATGELGERRLEPSQGCGGER